MELVEQDLNWGVFHSLRVPYPSEPSVDLLPTTSFFKILSTFLATELDVSLYRTMFARCLISGRETVRFIPP